MVPTLVHSERRIVEEYRFRFHVETGSSRPSELSLREIGLEEIEESLRAFLLRLSSLKSSLKVGRALIYGKF